MVRKTTDFFPLKFFPKVRSHEANGKLTLTNTYTREIYEYTLKGKVDDPLAEAMLEFSCNVGQVVSKDILIKNTNEEPIFYKIETDLSEVIKCLSEVRIGPKSDFVYTIEVMPTLGKNYFGKISFIDNTGNYKWYTISIEAKSTFSKKKLEMKTQVRKAIYIDITIENPSREVMIFDVDYEGNYIFGEKEVRVEPRSTNDYKLIFAPFRVGNWEGNLHISNDLIGEFLYKINCICEESQPIYTEMLKAELGKTSEYPLLLENPMNEDVEIEYSNSNLLNFSIVPSKIVIPALAASEVFIRYNPSSLELEENTVITFDSNKIGRWVVYARGKGTPPEEMEKTIVYTEVDAITSGIITFKNPLNEKLFVSIQLKCDDWPDAFKLMSGKDKINDSCTIEPLSSHLNRKLANSFRLYADQTYEILCGNCSLLQQDTLLDVPNRGHNRSQEQRNRLHI